MATLPTVKIVSKDSEGGYLVINESDLTKEHKIFVKKETSSKTTQKPKESLKK